MITIEGPENVEVTELAKVSGGSIAKPGQALVPMTVGLLEQALLKRYPRHDAEPWDRMGLLVGDPSEPVKGVCVALDPTLQAIEAAASLGANVLLTHHPAFIEPPESFSPSRDVASATGACVWTAAAKGVALMNVHTALDVSEDAKRLFMSLLSLDFEHMLVESAAGGDKGYGYACAVRESDKPFKLSHLSARCTSVFGRAPRVWGELDESLERIAFANGSAGDVAQACIAEGIDCLVCGEIRYHAAVDAAQAGLAIVELGHDASELPLIALLAQAVEEAGLSADCVHALDQSGNWRIPDSTRLSHSAVEWTR